MHKKEPSVWAVTLGYNHAADTVECLASVLKSDLPNLRVLFVDNNSQDNSVERVLAAFPSVDVIETGANLGFARGFNVGLTHALMKGADYVFMLNNDTVVGPDTIRSLRDAAEAHPEAGILVPKIYYHDRPDTLWSAGSRLRRFPPVIVLQRTRGPDDGRYDARAELQFATTCALLLPRPFLEAVGLLNPNFFILYDDYDLCLRARAAGFRIRLVPGARMTHKASTSTGTGTRSPFFWFHYGYSEMIFCRTHRAERRLTGWVHRAYVIARFLAEGHYYGLKPFLRGMRAGAGADLKPIPRWSEGGAEGAKLIREATT
jgi:GT2 family glycosyltransferase